MFHALQVYHDTEPHCAALNMAIDEALLERAGSPTLRFYRWRAPSVSFGYFGRCVDAESEFPQRELVRRWTGGGIVPHGEDLTYSVVLPQPQTLHIGNSRAVYSAIHGAIRRSLAAHMNVTLAKEAEPKISDACFANAVADDVIVDGRKLAGAAQRRTRAGLLHQGSIQSEALPESFAEAFATELCHSWAAAAFSLELLAHAREIAAGKYATAAWLHRR